MKFRDLTHEDIEVRIQSVKEKGIVLLLYKNARCDMSILDETVGAENWQRNHELINGNLFCNVGIRFNKSDTREFAEWVWKQDVGTESLTEKEKGQASDSFKRSCFTWGIGRELYTSPFIWIPIEQCNINNGKCFDRFAVEKIKIEDKKITAISIINETKKVRCFVWQKG